jgi:hypothetical protein
MCTASEVVETNNINTRRCRRTKQTLSAPRHIDRNAEAELSKLVWVTVGKTEHQAWLREEIGGDYTVLIRWEMTGREERVPILSVRHEAVGGGRRTRRKRPNAEIMEAMATSQQSRKRIKRESSKKTSSKNSKIESKSSNEKRSDSKRASVKAVESSQRVPVNKIISPHVLGDSEPSVSKKNSVNIPIPQKKSKIKNSGSVSLGDSSDDEPEWARSYAQTNRISESKIQLEEHSFAASSQVLIRGKQPSISLGSLAEKTNQSLIRGTQSEASVQWKKTDPPRRVSVVDDDSIPTLRTMEKFDDRLKEEVTAEHTTIL